jgi:hypothetical protein
MIIITIIIDCLRKLRPRVVVVVVVGSCTDRGIPSGQYAESRKAIIVGVAQGGVLGPLLILAYVRVNGIWRNTE